MERPPAPFILGVGRSGTTLLRLMLDAHPALAIPGETHFLAALTGSRPAGREEFLRIVTGAQSWPNMNMQPADLEAALVDAGPFSITNGLRAFYGLYARRLGKERWGDKTPTYRVCMPGIQGILPEAAFIHLIRDGRDVALSYQGLWFGPGDDMEAQARFWVEQIAIARRDSARLGRYMEVRYEDLVTDTGRVLGKICDYLELEFHPAMLDYHNAAQGRLAEMVQPVIPKEQPPVDLERFLSIHDRTKQPPDAGRIARWRTEMKEADRRRYEAIAGPLLRELGYERGD